MQGTLPGGASWPESVALSFASGATGFAPGIDQVISENAAQLWFSSNSDLGDALVSASVELPSELIGLLELLYAPNCIQGVPVTATSMPTETMTASATATETASPTITATGTATETATPSSTATDVPTETATASHTPTPLPTETATNTPTATSSATETSTPSETPTETPSSTATRIKHIDRDRNGDIDEHLDRDGNRHVDEHPHEHGDGDRIGDEHDLEHCYVHEHADCLEYCDRHKHHRSHDADDRQCELPYRRFDEHDFAWGRAPEHGLPLRGTASGSWIPVVCFGQNGWISSSYLDSAPVALRHDSHGSDRCDNHPGQLPDGR